MALKAIMPFTADITLEFEATGIAQLFDKISRMKGWAPEPCGKCGSQDVDFRKFTAKGKDIRGYKCQKCGAELSLFMNNETGDLWKCRKNKDGSIRGENGWSIYVPNQAPPATAYSAPDTDPVPTTTPGEVPF